MRKSSRAQIVWEGLHDSFCPVIMHSANPIYSGSHLRNPVFHVLVTSCEAVGTDCWTTLWRTMREIHPWACFESLQYVIISCDCHTDLYKTENILSKVMTVLHLTFVGDTGRCPVSWLDRLFFMAESLADCSKLPHTLWPDFAFSTCFFYAHIDCSTHIISSP